MSKNHSRRDFLKLMSTGTCGALAHRMFAPATGFLAIARPLEAFGAGTKRLIILNLSGGCSYNICPPYAGKYLERNPTVGFTPAQSLQITNDQGLHPSLVGVKALWDEGGAAVVNLVGYQNHNRSHDESTNIFHTAQRNISGGGEGWGARLTSQMQSAFGGVSLTGSNLFTKGGTNPPRVVSNLSTFGETRIFNDTAEAAFLRDIRTMNLIDNRPPTNEAEQYTQDSMVRLEGNIDSMKSISTTTLPVTFPNTGLARRFQDAAKLIAAGNLLNTQVIYIDHGGYDTHSNERASLTTRLNEVNGALTAFADCMKAMNLWQDTVVVTMSEFTRTMENNSGGTDHGAAGPMIVLGGGIKGGQKGLAPNDADVGTVEYIRNRHFNFSQVYGTIVNWMGFDTTKVFPFPELAATPYLDLF